MKKQSGIPTTYANYRFRSRLEAKWAAFFDELNWLWEYEPFDCNGWIPDFALLGHRGHVVGGGGDHYKPESPILVEVKPIMTFDQTVANKIDQADQEHEVLMLGLSPIWQPVSDIPQPAIGWLREVFLNVGARPTFNWDEAPILEWGADEWNNGESLVFGFCHATMSYHDRITGQYDGNNVVCDSDITHDYIQGCWAEAQNKTQWHK